jgi:hypothetical protein
MVNSLLKRLAMCPSTTSKHFPTLIPTFHRIFPPLTLKSITVTRSRELIISYHPIKKSNQPIASLSWTPNPSSNNNHPSFRNPHHHLMSMVQACIQGMHHSRSMDLRFSPQSSQMKWLRLLRLFSNNQLHRNNNHLQSKSQIDLWILSRIPLH